MEGILSQDHNAEGMDETHSQSRFVGNLAMTLLVLAVLFALLVVIASLTTPAIIL